MEKNRKNIIPVLLGADLNAYSVALAFREAYGVKSHVFARYKCGATENSNFIKTHISPGIDSVEVAVPELLKFAAENPCAELFLIPCADWYVEMIQKARGVLSPLYRIHIPELNMWRTLSDKSEFYKLMKKEKLPYPDCVSFSDINDVTEEKLSDFTYPAVMKPSDSTEYWQNPFDDMQKVYFPKSSTAAKETAYKIFASGYSKSVILQKLVGSKNGNRVLTTVSDNKGRVIRAVLGDVILEEVGKTSFGNHAAIISIPLDEISFRLIDFLDKISYRGIANFDIMTDGREKYVLEINTRQGRSCDYMRAAGVNIAELFVKIARGENVQPDFFYKEIYWHYPPHKSVMEHAGEAGKEKAERFFREGKSSTPYTNSFEGIKRRAYVAIHNMRLARTVKKDARSVENI